MKVEIDGNKIRIKGKNYGEEYHLIIYVSEEKGEDTFSINWHKVGFESGCLPRITVTSSNIIIENTLPVGKSFID